MPDASDRTDTTDVTETEVAEDETTNVPTDDAEGTTEDTEDQDAETFPRNYVEKLRKESAGYRDRAKAAEARVEELGKRLHSSLVAATGRLQDASDLSYAAEHLGDAGALSGAIETLLAERPHLRARKPSGDVGQGVKGDNSSGRFSLLERLKQTV